MSSQAIYSRPRWIRHIDASNYPLEAQNMMPRNVSESQHGNVDYESNSTPHAGSWVDLRNFTPVTCNL
jgi:hypothetical protein